MIAKEPEKSTFIPPPEGATQGVIVDVVDLGYVENKFDTTKGPQHKARVVWEVEATHPKYGNPLTASKRYTVSLHEKASLRKDVEALKGKKFTKDELKGWDVESLIGENAQLLITHNTGDDGTIFANITAIMPLGRGAEKMTPSATYIRVKDRPAKGGPAAAVITTKVVDLITPTVRVGPVSKLALIGDDVADIRTVAAKIAESEGEDIGYIINAASEFKSKEGSMIGFRDPEGKSPQWVKRTLDKLKKRAENIGFAAEVEGDLIPF